MEVTETRHITINGKYKVQFERSAVKGVIGFKVEANGDDYNTTLDEAVALMKSAENNTPIVEVK